MNILIAANYATPKSGNFIASLITLARKIRENGSNVYFVFPKRADWIEWFEKENFNVDIIDYENYSIDEQFCKLNELIKRYEIDIIHIHFGMFRQALVRNRSKIKSVKILVHDHMDLYVGANYFLQRMGFVFLSLVYAIKKITVITVNKQKKTNYFFLKRKWFVPNGLSLERYVSYSMTREECRAKLGLAPEEKTCFLLGWDLKRKGLDIALKAVQRCREKDPTVVLGIIGAGEGTPSDYAKAFIRNECGIDPDEPWIRYFDNFEDMFAVHRAIDIYISASRKEAFSYGILESISQNTPTVVSDIKGTKWASEYTNCHFYPVEDPDKCADAITKALQNGRRDSNYLDIIDKYSIDKWCNNIIEIYKKL